MKYNDMLQCFENMFQAIQAHEWMNDAHVYEMQVQMWKPNTWGVTEGSEKPEPPGHAQRARPPVARGWPLAWGEMK